MVRNVVEYYGAALLQAQKRFFLRRFPELEQNVISPIRMAYREGRLALYLLALCCG